MTLTNQECIDLMMAINARKEELKQKTASASKDTDSREIERLIRLSAKLNKRNA